MRSTHIFQIQCCNFVYLTETDIANTNLVPQMEVHGFKVTQITVIILNTELQNLISFVIHEIFTISENVLNKSFRTYYNAHLSSFSVL
jgi:hypothetical protein